MNEEKKPLVYTCFCTDNIHEGHLNILREARKLGEVVLGVLCDEEMDKKGHRAGQPPVR